MVEFYAKGKHCKALLLSDPEAPEFWDSLAEGKSGKGETASDFSDRFSPRVLKTTIMSSWQSINWWKQ